MGDTRKAREKKAKPGTKIVFGDGLLVGEVIDIVEEGNRLIQFTYEGIFEEILDRLGQMPLPPYITHERRIKTAIRPSMQSMKDQRRLRQPDCILRRSFCSRCGIWV